MDVSWGSFWFGAATVVALGLVVMILCVAAAGPPEPKKVKPGDEIDTVEFWRLTVYFAAPGKPPVIARLRHDDRSVVEGWAEEISLRMGKPVGRQAAYSGVVRIEVGENWSETIDCSRVDRVKIHKDSERRRRRDGAVMIHFPPI